MSVSSLVPSLIYVVVIFPPSRLLLCQPLLPQVILVPPGGGGQRLGMVRVRETCRWVFEDAGFIQPAPDFANRFSRQTNSRDKETRGRGETATATAGATAAEK